MVKNHDPTGASSGDHTQSREQVYRPVAQMPQRLSMNTLVALCDILDCAPDDLVKPEVVNTPVRKTADGDTEPAPITPRRLVASSAVRCLWRGPADHEAGDGQHGQARAV